MKKRQGKAIKTASEVVLIEQEITKKNGFRLADQTKEAVEMRKTPILILSEFFKRE